jgi:hypothetical protein
VETLSSLGGTIAYLLLGAALMIGPGYLGFIVAQRTKRRAVGWAVGLASFAAAVLLFGESYMTLKKVSCRGAADVGACIDGVDAY